MNHIHNRMEGGARKIAQYYETKCSICGDNFKGRTASEAVCDPCWVENDLRPCFKPIHKKKKILN